MNTPAVSLVAKLCSISRILQGLLERGSMQPDLGNTECRAGVSPVCLGMNTDFDPCIKAAHGMDVTAPLRENLPWYALQVQSRLAGLTSATLRRKGYETFLPSYTTRRRWSDRIKLIEAPLFPGYLFCRFDIRNPLPVLVAPGMMSIVGAGKIPVAIDEEEIEAVRMILHSGLATQIWPFLEVGSRICINGGPLKGLEGVLVNTNKVDRLVVSVTLLQRSVAVEIDRQWVSPAGDVTGPRYVTGPR